MRSQDSQRSYENPLAPMLCSRAAGLESCFRQEFARSPFTFAPEVQQLPMRVNKGAAVERASLARPW